MLKAGAGECDVLLAGTNPFLPGLISNPAGSVDIVEVFMWRLLGKLSHYQMGSPGTVPHPCASPALTAGSPSNTGNGERKGRILEKTASESWAGKICL